jgi:branched-subunit amino acid transport protein
LSEKTFLVVVVAIGLGTILIRLSFLPLAEQTSRIPILERAPRFVPAAVFPALVMPALLYQDGALDLSSGNARLLSGLVAVVVARLTKNTSLTIASGIFTLWLLQAMGLGGPD